MLEIEFTNIFLCPVSNNSLGFHTVFSLFVVVFNCCFNEWKHFICKINEKLMSINYYNNLGSTCTRYKINALKST